MGGRQGHRHPRRRTDGGMTDPAVARPPQVEVVAGALQDHHRAVLVGSRSFGVKAQVQATIPLASGGAMLLTVARASLHTVWSFRYSGTRHRA